MRGDDSRPGGVPVKRNPHDAAPRAARCHDRSLPPLDRRANREIDRKGEPGDRYVPPRQVAAGENAVTRDFRGSVSGFMAGTFVPCLAGACGYRATGFSAGPGRGPAIPWKGAGQG